MALQVAENCSLCAAVQESLGRCEPTSLANTALAMTDRFVVMPSIGPMVAGQVIVVSRSHYPSLGAMGDAAIREYEEVRRRFGIAEGDLLEAEHGSTATDCAGACVVHAHVHWIPGFAQYADIFDGYLDELHVGDDLRLPESSPYFFIRGSGTKVRVFDAAGLPSQMLRQTLCSVLGREDWDWRKDARIDLIEESVAIWKARDGR